MALQKEHIFHIEGIGVELVPGEIAYDPLEVFQRGDLASADVIADPSYFQGGPVVNPAQRHQKTVPIPGNHLEKGHHAVVTTPGRFCDKDDSLLSDAEKVPLLFHWGRQRADTLFQELFAEGTCRLADEDIVGRESSQRVLMRDFQIDSLQLLQMSVQLIGGKEIIF